ncbi:hypothetical protein acsn021_06710 [Anaerocolumna cellulosilytica]|uniref:Uncharacterized protein n=1 Tax=Anaerocolumna cellulosilytica TaxID=433286 RepID=A0A6S6R0M9_9FIRM|nr:hypothetical protein [Anaerocolumna cellulosilytica]MBB5197675.1 hypothetical protein [Anaerocolumna cellulosilytica]BCJ93102.1 hypothetical protein acsn021_06710 [Anaerocolumna cellulosilytica]
MLEMDKKSFWKTEVPKNIKTGVMSAATAAFISAAITFVSGSIMERPTLADVIVLLLLGLGIQFARSRFCAIFILIYYVISQVLLFAEGYGGKNFIMWFLFVSIYVKGIKAVFQYHKLWRLYLSGDYISENTVSMKVYNDIIFNELHSNEMETNEKEIESNKNQINLGMHNNSKQ